MKIAGSSPSYSFAPLQPAGRLAYGLVAMVVLLPQYALNAAINLISIPLLPSASSLEALATAAGLIFLAVDFIRERGARKAAAAT